MPQPVLHLWVRVAINFGCAEIVQVLSARQQAIHSTVLQACLLLSVAYKDANLCIALMFVNAQKLFKRRDM